MCCAVRMQFLNIKEETLTHIVMGILTLFANIGTRWVYDDLDDKLESFLASKWMRKVYVFSIIYVATRDLRLSVMMTIAYWFLMYFGSTKDT